MTRLRRAVLRLLRANYRDLLALAGIGCIGWGLWLIAPPLALCVVGIFLFLSAAVSGARAT